MAYGEHTGYKVSWMVCRTSLTAVVYLLNKHTNSSAWTWRGERERERESLTCVHNKSHSSEIIKLVCSGRKQIKCLSTVVYSSVYYIYLWLCSQQVNVASGQCEKCLEMTSISTRLARCVAHLFKQYGVWALLIDWQYCSTAAVAVCDWRAQSGVR